jgi:hypothetical protein
MHGLAAILSLRRLGLQLSEARKQNRLISGRRQTSFLVPGQPVLQHSGDRKTWMSRRKSIDSGLERRTEVGS